MTSRIDIIGQNGGTAEHYDMKKYAVASEGCSHYLTPGKQYEIIREVGRDTFLTVDDEGEEIICLFWACSHNKSDWEIVEKPDTENLLDELSQQGQEMQPDEYTGGSVSYYKVRIDSPTSGGDTYTAECNDIIEALGMNYAEGNIFKAIWRRAAAKQHGVQKKGYDNGLYDAEKCLFFSERLVEQSRLK